MTQPAKGQEPSMEEILASIRRIIADDDPARSADESRPAAHEAYPPQPSRPLSPPPRAPAPMSDPAGGDEDIDSMLAQLQATSRQPPASVNVEESQASERTPEPAPAFRTVGERADMESEKRPSEPAAARTGEERRPAAAETGDRGLVSAATTAAVGSAFHSLAQTVQMRNDRTLEDVVSEILRPMLKIWLDENLPIIVERLVRAEIERVARGRG